MTHDVDLTSFFPYKGKQIRAEQWQAVEFAIKAFDEGKKFVVLGMGTGTGKSATGLTIANYLRSLDPLSSAYVLTTQKILQQQYIDDFGSAIGGPLRSIKSSSNYRCKYYTDQSCGESRRVISKLRKQLTGTAFLECCTKQCSYALEKAQFLESEIGITNFSYFLAETMYMDAVKGKKIEPRKLLIIDECHNIETSLASFIEVSFSEKFAKEVLQSRLPKRGSNLSMSIVVEWVKGPYRLALGKQLDGLSRMLEALLSSGDPTQDPKTKSSFERCSKQHELLDKHQCKVNRFIEAFDEGNWVMNIIEPMSGKKDGRRFEFKPIDVGQTAQGMLYRFGDRVLMMSATIIDIDTFCRTIGLKRSEVAYLQIPSPFKAENRPIHYMGVGKMSFDHIDASLPKMVEAISMVLDLHSNEKGIIHCTSFKVAKFLKEHLKSDRLLIHGSDDRESILEQHINGSGPTVLVSPSMMEGIDLADDASRFQVLCKLPFPYLGDKVVQRRKERDPNWYSFQTVKSIVQALGRSIRHASDHATSYILDGDWEYFYRRNRAMFPDEFVLALR